MTDIYKCPYCNDTLESYDVFFDKLTMTWEDLNYYCYTCQKLIDFDELL